MSIMSDSGLQIPRGCESCPVQCEFSNEYDALLLKKVLGEYAASGLVGETGEALEKMLGELIGDEEQAPNMAAGLRRATAEELNELDDELQALQQQATMYGQSCDKPLKMRASKDGKTYTAAVCTSALAYYVNSDQPKHTYTHVWVTTPKE